jgi:hypothetical protein
VATALDHPLRVVALKPNTLRPFSQVCARELVVCQPVPPPG